MFTSAPLLTLIRGCVTLGFCAIAAQAIAAPNSPAPKALAPLLSTVNERLNIADLVALTKWDSAKPIQDNAREVQVISNAKQQASAHGLEPEDVANLLTAQIEANKLIQYGLLAQWQAAGKAPKTQRPDLANQIRPRLDELQNRLLQQYADFAAYRNDPECVNWLTHARARLAKDPLHRLALIRATGELCVKAKT